MIIFDKRNVFNSDQFFKTVYSAINAMLKIDEN